jgi:hypothetical protein
MIFKGRTWLHVIRIVLPVGAVLAVLMLPGSPRGQETKSSMNGQADQRHAESAQKKIPFPRPQSHAGNWLQYHGASADLYVNEAGGRGKACYTCHEKNDCIDCHNTMMPRDHTNTWRTLSHGFQAAGNRERCSMCHRQDYCVRCHNETAPRSHRGRWNAVTYSEIPPVPDTPTHCTWCHYDGGFAPADNCVVCHRQARHTSASHPVNPAVDCSTCHH